VALRAALPCHAAALQSHGWLQQPDPADRASGGGPLDHDFLRGSTVGFPVPGSQRRVSRNAGANTAGTPVSCAVCVHVAPANRCILHPRWGWSYLGCSTRACTAFTAFRPQHALRPPPTAKRPTVMDKRRPTVMATRDRANRRTAFGSTRSSVRLSYETSVTQQGVAT
jgi:hypothetical protein